MNIYRVGISFEQRHECDCKFCTHKREDNDAVAYVTAVDSDAVAVKAAAMAAAIVDSGEFVDVFSVMTEVYFETEWPDGMYFMEDPADRIGDYVTDGFVMLDKALVFVLESVTDRGRDVIRGTAAVPLGEFVIQQSRAGRIAVFSGEFGRVAFRAEYVENLREIGVEVWSVREYGVRTRCALVQDGQQVGLIMPLALHWLA